MIVQLGAKTIEELNKAISKNNIAKEDIINIVPVYDKGNPDWGIICYVLFYFKK